MSKDVNEEQKPGNSQLRTRREEVAAALLASKYGDPDHAALEQIFNAIEKELFVPRRGSETYEYKHDVRHHFLFDSKPNPADGSKEIQFGAMATKADGTTYAMLPPNKVINWRNTKAGRKAERENKESKHRHHLDDAGHLIALEFGTSPSDPNNVADQEFISNQRRGWRTEERELKRFVEARADCRVRVEVKYSKDKYGQRSTYRKMEITDGNNLVLSPGNVLHMNVKSVDKDRREATERNQKIQRTIAYNHKHGIKAPLTLVPSGKG